MEAKKGAGKAMAYHDYVFVKSGKLLYLDLWSIVCVCGSWRPAQDGETSFQSTILWDN